MLLCVPSVGAFQGSSIDLQKRPWSPELAGLPRLQDVHAGKSRPFQIVSWSSNSKMKTSPSGSRLFIGDSSNFPRDERDDDQIREWKATLTEMVAMFLTIVMGVASGLLVVTPTFWAQYHGMTQGGGFLLLWIWTGIQAGVFASIYRMVSANENGFVSNSLVLAFVALRVFLQDPFLDTTLKFTSILESIVLFSGVSLALDYCIWKQFIAHPRR